MPIDHLGIYADAENHEKTVAFYLAFLAPLGYEKKMEFLDGKVVGLGIGRPDFWIFGVPAEGMPQPSLGRTHFAFPAPSRDLVDECYQKGVAAGGVENGAPGLRPMYHPSYYGGFLIDPVGNTTEVVNRED